MRTLAVRPKQTRVDDDKAAALGQIVCSLAVSLSTGNGADAAKLGRRTGVDEHLIRGSALSSSRVLNYGVCGPLVWQSRVGSANPKKRPAALQRPDRQVAPREGESCLVCHVPGASRHDLLAVAGPDSVKGPIHALADTMFAVAAKPPKWLGARSLSDAGRTAARSACLTCEDESNRLR